MVPLQFVWKAIRTIDSEKRDLRFCLQGYLVALAAAAVGAALVLLSFLGVFSTAEQDVSTLLNTLLNSYEKMVSTHYQSVGSQGMALSRLLTGQIEKTLAAEQVSFSDVNDQSRLIALLEKKTYPLLRQSLLMTECTGAFMVLEATVNTSIPKAEFSRCGLYLKFANINLANPGSSALTLLRGIPDMVRENDISFHAQWEMEFTTNTLAFYKLFLAKAKPDLAFSYYYAMASPIRGTMEYSMRLLVPLVGSSGQVYGVCGFEISDLYYKLIHAQYHPELPHLIGLLTPKAGVQLFPAYGLESGSHAGYFGNLGAAPLEVKPSKLYNTYTNNQGTFVGLEKPIHLSPLRLSGKEGDGLVVAVMIPQADLAQRMEQANLRWALCSGLFMGLALVVAVLLHCLCVRPAVDKIRNAG